MSNLDMIIDAFKNVKQSVKEQFDGYKQKKWKQDQRFKADMFYDSAKEVVAHEMGLDYQLPTDKEIDETASKTRLTPVGPEVPKEVDAFLKKKSYAMGKDLLLEDTMERLGLNQVYQALLNSIEEGEEIDFEFQDYLDLVTPIRPTEEI
jgi:hypothetical protein